ncbi:hypothetical protein DID88_004831 [Monilinia fructigena]|uniref:Peptidyl-prolyl cis-trans isomerase n=1 Tax=Monilinia fructigena TaxID=38457 RepID=A0A395IS97_9HELO|nr:hypothetical protein DID88_004831 [Monilinia fructigena]
MAPAKKAAGKGGKEKAMMLAMRKKRKSKAHSKSTFDIYFAPSIGVSEDKARAGGALGWKGKGDLDPEFEKVAFEMEASTTTKPKYRDVKTGFGYHIIMVEGRK